MDDDTQGRGGRLTNGRTEFLKDLDDLQRFATVGIETCFVGSGFDVISSVVLWFGISFGVRRDVDHDEMRALLLCVCRRFVSGDTECSSGIIDSNLHT